MDLYEFFLIVHLLLFVYWLGGDMGVFYSSGMVIDPKLSDSARMTAAKIMVNLDFVPRICMTLMLTVGGVLSDKFVPHPLWQTVGMWLLAPSLARHGRQHSPERRQAVCETCHPHRLLVPLDHRRLSARVGERVLRDGPLNRGTLGRRQAGDFRRARLLRFNDSRLHTGLHKRYSRAGQQQRDR